MRREYYTSFEQWQLAAAEQSLTIQVSGTVYRALALGRLLGFYDRAHNWGRLDWPLPELELTD
jgi:hypothetical protein